MAENVMVTATVTVENIGVAGKQLLLQRLPPLKLLPLRWPLANSSMSSRLAAGYLLFHSAICSSELTSIL